MKREMICIMCPMGCNLTVEYEGEEIKVSGNTCNRGVSFAQEEVKCPKRTLTTLVKTKGGVKACKTTKPIPKELLFDAMKEIEKLRLEKADFGEIVVKDLLGTGADVVVTAND